MEVKDWRFPMACPKCHRVTATPKRVVNWLDEDVTISLECAWCDHVYEITGRAQALFVPQLYRTLNLHH